MQGGQQPTEVPRVGSGSPVVEYEVRGDNREFLERPGRGEDILQSWQMHDRACIWALRKRTNLKAWQTGVEDTKHRV